MRMKTEVKKKKKNVRLSPGGKKKKKKEQAERSCKHRRGSERVSVCPLDSTDREREREEKGPLPLPSRSAAQWVSRHLADRKREMVSVPRETTEEQHSAQVFSNTCILLSASTVPIKFVHIVLVTHEMVQIDHMTYSHASDRFLY